MLYKPFLYIIAVLLMLVPCGTRAQDSSSVSSDSVSNTGAQNSGPGLADSLRTAPAQIRTAAAVTDSAGGGLVLPAALETNRTDSLAPTTSPGDSASRVGARVARPRPRADGIEVKVIPWDWDQYTNVVEVGLRRLRDGVEYSLTRNEWYDSLFIRYQGRVLQVRGRTTRDEDGFYNMTVNAILPPDTTAIQSGGASQP